MEKAIPKKEEKGCRLSTDVARERGRTPSVVVLAGARGPLFKVVRRKEGLVCLTLPTQTASQEEGGGGRRVTATQLRWYNRMRNARKEKVLRPA